MGKRTCDHWLKAVVNLKEGTVGPATCVLCYATGNVRTSKITIVVHMSSRLGPLSEGLDNVILSTSESWVEMS